MEFLKKFKVFSFLSDKVEIRMFGHGVYLLPVNNTSVIMLEAINESEVEFQSG